MRIFFKQLMRKPILTAMLSFLLVLGVSFSAISFSAWSTAHQQRETISSGYVTIALSREQSLSGEIESGYSSFTTYEDGSIEWSDGTWYYPPELLETVASQAPGVQSIDRRCILGAHVEGAQALSSGRVDILEYNEAFDQYSYNMVVLAVKCTALDEMNEDGEKTENGTTWRNRSYFAEFEIVEAVSRLRAYALLPENGKLWCTDWIYCADGTLPFEIGKTYLVRGFYGDFPIVQDIDEASSNTEGYSFYWRRADPELDDIYASRSLTFTPSSLCQWEDVHLEEGGRIIGEGVSNCTADQVFDPERFVFYECVPENSLPFFAEYTGDWRDFLNTEEGAVWRDEVIPLCELNYESATVMLTDNLQSLYAFNTGDADVLEGRSITPEEFQEGANVCLVSASYASANGLAVGDTLNLDYYDSGCALEEGTIRGMLQSSKGNTIVRFPLVPETRIGVQKDYTIVGIYTAPAFSFGTHSFHADTIFVPKASVPGAEEYEEPSIAMLNSIILENGASETFEDYMELQGYGGLYLYFDQNFGDTVAALEAMESNAFRLFLAGSVVFLLVAALFCYLNFRQMMPVIHSMRLLGIPISMVRREILTALIPASVIIVALGTGLGMALFSAVVDWLVSASINLSVLGILVCTGAQLVVLLIAVIVWSAVAVDKNLMQRK